MLRLITFLVLLGAGLQHAYSQAPSVEGDQGCAPPNGTLPLEFHAGGNVLRGYIDVPPSTDPSPAIVMVNGSLPTDVMRGGSIGGLRRVFGEMGIAYATWDNPGSGCSTGTLQGPPDLYGRVDEVAAVLDSLKARNDIDATRIGALALSQGGWVSVMAAARSDDLAFLMIMSGPGRDMTRQAVYLVRSNLELEGYSAEESVVLVRQYEKSQVMALAGATYGDYLEAIEPLSEHPFFQKLEALGGILQWTPEQYEEIQNSPSFLVSTDTFLSAITVPVLAIYGDKDSLVNWREGLDIFRVSLARTGNQDLTTHVFEGTNHNMCRVETGSLDEMVARQRCERPEGFREVFVSWLTEHGFRGK